MNTQIPVDADAFLIWLGDKLRDMGQVPVDNGRRMDASRELVNTAIEYLDLLSEDDRDEVFDVIINSSETGMIGEYRIPYDDRDHYDWIEGILATLEGYLED